FSFFSFTIPLFVFSLSPFSFFAFVKSILRVKVSCTFLSLLLSFFLFISPAQLSPIQEGPEILQEKVVFSHLLITNGGCHSR
ncbi:hypothetical protein EDC96DRAFT_607713, partial [Choanephora cucurbitarum]